MESRKGKETLRVEYTYDEGGRLLKKQDSRNGTTIYEYDNAGNLTARWGEGTGQSGDAGTEYHYLYDNAGRLSAVTDKDTLLMAALYDGNDNRTFMMEEMKPVRRNPSGQRHTGRKRRFPCGKRGKFPHRKQRRIPDRRKAGGEGTFQGKSVLVWNTMPDGRHFPAGSNPL